MTLFVRKHKNLRVRETDEYFHDMRNSIELLLKEIEHSSKDDRFFISLKKGRTWMEKVFQAEKETMDSESVLQSDIAGQDTTIKIPSRSDETVRVAWAETSTTFVFSSRGEAFCQKRGANFFSQKMSDVGGILELTRSQYRRISLGRQIPGW